MRVAILTQALRYNYGGILQNYALQTVLRGMGHDVVTLDPKRYIYPKWKYPIVFLRHAAARYIKGHKEVPIFAEYMEDKLHRLYGVNTYKFIDRYIKRKEYTNLYVDIQDNDYDAFVIGSDQVWRPKLNWRLTQLENMFLDFAQEWNVKRIAYAASFGTDEWEFTEKQTEDCKKMISLFDALSVREDSGMILCKEKFGKDVQHVLDPTLLLNYEDYMDLVNRSPSQGMRGDLYTYILDETEETKKLICDFAKYKQLVPYTYNSKIQDWRHEHTIEEKIQPPVELWLKGFEQAKYVFTDSFHACVFSIIFKKQFFLFGNYERGMSRYLSLFRMLGIGDRLVRSIDDIENIKDIDYNCVYSKLNELQSKSYAFLRNALMCPK